MYTGLMKVGVTVEHNGRPAVVCMADDPAALKYPKTALIRYLDGERERLCVPDYTLEEWIPDV